VAVPNRAKSADRALDPLLIPLPVAFFVATLVGDLIFWQTGEADWIWATRWLLGAGILMALAAAVAGLFDDGERRRDDAAVTWWHRRGNVLALLVAAVNWYVRAGPDAAAVLPAGLALSAIAVSVLLMTGWWSRGPGLPRVADSD
jgi:uncharacterized membrane protein